MPMPEPVGVIHQHSKSSSGNYEGLDLVRCVGGWQPGIHEVWNFDDDRSNPRVHPFACIVIGAFVGDCFAANYLTENGRRVPMFGRKLVNVSFQCQYSGYLCGLGEMRPQYQSELE